MPSSRVILPIGGPLRNAFEAMIAERRVVLFAGLPGVGKSLLVKQLALMALEAGREVHLLQWDVARPAFELPPWHARYPEIAGVTHPAVRKAVGLWSRGAVLDWHRRHGDNAILIGELPLIGNRLIELAQPHNDAAEALLAGPATLFVVPVPSTLVRTEIEAARERTMAQPQHRREAADAPPGVLRRLWRELHDLAVTLGQTEPAADDAVAYRPQVYESVYRHLLAHRHYQLLTVDERLPVSSSVYALDGIAGELTATPDQVGAIMERLEATTTAAQLEREVANWHQISPAAGDEAR